MVVVADKIAEKLLFVLSYMDVHFVAALAAIVIHVANYNITAHLEFNTRIFTNILGKNAIYYYAVYLVLSALIRDHFINESLKRNINTLPIDDRLSLFLGSILFIFGVLLNLWTLKTLGVKGMYNGDSFGWLFDAPVVDGPYVYFNDPQYVGTTAACVGSALYYKSLNGIIFAFVMGAVFYISVKFVEGPHMQGIYSNRAKSDLYGKKKN